MSKTRNKTKDTCCKLCVFAEYVDITQVGCAVNMLDNAREAGLTVLECYDQEKEFNVISNRQCMMYRPREWANKQAGKDGRLSEIAKKELSILFKAVVLMEDNTSLEEVTLSIEALKNQKVKPNLVVIILPVKNDIEPEVIKDIMMTSGFNYWEVRKLIDDREGRKAIDLFLHFKTHSYTACFRAGKDISLNFFSDIGNEVNLKFFQFGMLTNESDKEGKEPIHGIVFPHVVWANYGNSIVDLEKCLKDDLCQDKIYQIQQVVKDFQ